MTLHEIAAEMGISHQAVWEIQNRALAKMLRAFKRHGLTYEDLEDCLKFSE